MECVEEPEQGQTRSNFWRRGIVPQHGDRNPLEDGILRIRVIVRVKLESRDTKKAGSPRQLSITITTPKCTHNAAPITPKYAAPIVLSSVGSARLVSRGAITLRMGGRGRREGGEKQGRNTQPRERNERWMPYNLDPRCLYFV